MTAFFEMLAQTLWTLFLQAVGLALMLMGADE
jgi:hypothetical protein